jgi:hypothetical protein
VWCLAHQLGIAIKLAMCDIFDRGHFPFMNTLTTMVGWLRRQETLIRNLASGKCPSVINVRWKSTITVLQWLFANRERATDHMALKRFTGALSDTWWLVATICNRYFSAVNITFDTLQVEVSRQYENLGRLSKELQNQFQATPDESFNTDSPDITGSSKIPTMRQFSVAEAGLGALCQGIDVEALELVQSLDDAQKNVALRSAAIVYLVSLNGIARIMKGRQSTHRESEAIPGVYPLQISEMSVVAFVELVSGHNERLLSAFDAAFVSKVFEQHKALIRILELEPVLRARLERESKKEFSVAWSGVGSRFSELQTFAAGIATIMPTTSRVEGDFSLMNYRRNEYCANLTDISLEGVMHSKQYPDLLKDVLDL